MCHLELNGKSCQARRLLVSAFGWLLASVLLLPGWSPVLHAQAVKPFGSTYQARPGERVVFVHANIYPGTGGEVRDGFVAVADGQIAAVGAMTELSENRDIADFVRVDLEQRWLTPGIIDVHSHVGDYPSPAIASTLDGNEATSPNTARVWAEHSVWPQDPQFALALAGGVTTLQILPGSANLFGGRGVTLKNVPARTVQEMKFPGAPHSLKMACGENPKRVYGAQGKTPSTRMGNVAGYRSAWAEAADYRRKVNAAKDDPEKSPPDRDLTAETLIGVLDGEIIVHNHCYRADEMAVMIDVAREFGYRIGTFLHAIESYKVADILAAEGICSAMWADWWGSKLELFDGVQQNIALVHRAGACAVVHSDSALGIQRLNQEAAKARTAALRMGMDIPPGVAIQWVTQNAARSLGIAEQTGTLAAGMAADLVIWSEDPLSVYALADQVYIDGYKYYDRGDPERQPVSDFDLQQTVGGKR